MGEPSSNSDTHVNLVAGKPSSNRWVQVPRRSMEAMAALMGDSPAAAQLLLTVTAKMGRHNAFIASNAVLSELTGLHVSTVKRALHLLRDRKWIKIVKVGSTKSVRAIVINDTVAWEGPVEGKRYSLFTATVLASELEQEAEDILVSQEPSIEVPAIYRGEVQIPSGDGLPPPSQPSLEGLESDLPTRDVEQIDLEDFTNDI